MILAPHPENYTVNATRKVSQNLWAFQAGLIAITVPGFALSYGINLAEHYALRRAGLLAPLVLRLAFYLIWHVLYVH